MTAPLSKEKLLADLPEGLRKPLLASYQEITSNFAEHRWEPSELNGGKFCEVVYCILEGALNGTFPAHPAKPKNMAAACRTLETFPVDSTRVGDRSLRILIPRVLIALYEVRNNRGVGHVGGDVNPNFMDATLVQGAASWILAELVRIFHKVSTSEAQELVDLLIERRTPLVWEFENTRRVLDPSMSKKDQTLLLLHGKPSWTGEDDLVAWIEYSSKSMFRKRVLTPLHDDRLVEHDSVNARVRISPLGVSEVEKRILNSKV